MAMYANVGGVNKLLAQTFAEGSAGGGASVNLALGGTSSITFTATKIVFLLTNCYIQYNLDGRDEITYSSSNVIGIYSVSTGKALYVNISIACYNSVSAISLAEYNSNIVLSYIGQRSGVGVDTRQNSIGQFSNKPFTLATQYSQYYPYTNNRCTFSYIILS